MGLAFVRRLLFVSPIDRGEAQIDPQKCIPYARSMRLPRVGSAMAAKDAKLEARVDRFAAARCGARDLGRVTEFPSVCDRRGYEWVSFELASRSGRRRPCCRVRHSRG